MEYNVIDLGFGTGMSQNAQGHFSWFFPLRMPENLYIGKFSPKTAF